MILSLKSLWPELIGEYYQDAKEGGYKERETLWQACRQLIEDAAFAGLSGIHPNRHQIRNHPLFDESAVIFLEFIERYDGPKSEFSAALTKEIRGKLSNLKRSWISSKRREERCCEPEQERFNEHALSEMQLDIQEAIKTLPESQRRIIDLKLQDFPVNQIADLLGVSRQTVSTRCRKACDHLKRYNHLRRYLSKPIYRGNRKRIERKRNLASAGEDAST
ncbi:sigma-70 family RNA polymerase sigma factor [Bremerella alba]|uniref:RNA polymerase sigma factor 70 region 4 type 2 domain-containing protein n=1 Tax=Bremerella alba TaxID=980252 RepID=A0A7V8V8B9_9BACT|nr:sigma-70 family RNA polymerase sigma factor [Bremerella alba]MBA2116830.1 hypothetical protein [Bremerella alba]